MSLKGKCAVITGGGQGIGRALCLAFAREGASVMIAEEDAEAGRECEELVRSAGGTASFLRTDVSRETDVAAMAAEAAARFGGIHALVNNAGLSRFGDLFDSPTSLWERVLAVNLTGAFLCARECARFMKASGGSIVNIASTRAFQSEPGSEAYAASKGGIAALTHALALSLGPHHIRVNAVSPGWIEVTDWKKEGAASPPALRPVDHEQHPAGRVGRPEDVAAACLFLCSPGAGFITGADLKVDGGMTVKMIYAP